MINCNFINNTAEEGGAIRIGNMGTVSDCNFINNTAKDGSAIMMKTGNVSNCNFTNNKADNYSTIYSRLTGTVTNCNFADNSASKGGAIYCKEEQVTADTCIFKTSSDSKNTNVTILPPTLNVDNFTTVYNSGEKLTFDLKTNSGLAVSNGIISISVYFKNNDSWVGNYSCLSGDGWAVDLQAGSYYAVFNTEYAGFESIKRSIKIMPNIPYYINVTSLTSNNRTVNITAKSNIPQDILEGELVFILQNGNPIDAKYIGNEIWWAVHEFDEYIEYSVSASYRNLDNVTINNGTISIYKANSTLTIRDNITFDYGSNGSLTVTFSNASGVVASVDGHREAIVNIVGNTITVSNLTVGNYTLKVTTITAENYNNVTKTANITVNKVNSTLTVNDIIFDYGGVGSTKVSYTHALGINATVIGQPKAIVVVIFNTITISGLDAGTYTLNITTIVDENSNPVTKTANITVNKAKTVITASAIATTFNVNEYLTITLKDAKGNLIKGASITVNINGAKKYTTNANGQVKVPTKGLIPKAYTAKITFNGNANYEKSTKNVKVTIKKAATKITAGKKTFKVKTKVKKYSAVLKDNTGKAVKNAKLTLKVNGKTYAAKTNSKGKAIFKITKLNKNGSFKES